MKKGTHIRLTDITSPIQLKELNDALNKLIIKIFTLEQEIKQIKENENGTNTGSNK